MALGALGVVYGDIGTSPLYTVKECFHGLFKFAPGQGSRLSGGPSPEDSPEKPIGDSHARRSTGWTGSV